MARTEVCSLECHAWARLAYSASNTAGWRGLLMDWIIIRMDHYPCDWLAARTTRRVTASITADVIGLPSTNGAEIGAVPHSLYYRLCSTDNCESQSVAPITVTQGPVYVRCHESTHDSGGSIGVQTWLTCGCVAGRSDLLMCECKLHPFMCQEHITYSEVLNADHVGLACRCSSCSVAADYIQISYRKGFMQCNGS